ncbi:MAG: energy coupling factor transporter S component ThiW [Defluviitaleaceae bacterium]|nr:energy coupling factor transporter S component ThiW [Defluviitaleaceae bacterium]
MNHAKKLTIAGVLVAVGVALSPFSIPVGIARAFPVQHMINVIGGVLLGPVYAAIMAFTTASIRNMLGTGTLLAFPGSMIGALMAGLAAKYVRGNLLPACAAELVGTGLLGALIAYPVAAFILGREVALFAFVIPFTASSITGAAIAFVLLTVLMRTGIFEKYINAT